MIAFSFVLLEYKKGGLLVVGVGFLFDLLVVWIYGNDPLCEIRQKSHSDQSDMTRSLLIVNLIRVWIVLCVSAVTRAFSKRRIGIYYAYIIRYEPKGKIISDCT